MENAIKHGISPCRAGGEVVVLARLARANTNQPMLDDTLQIWVRDTGAGASEQALEYGRRRGVGLQNVERRLKCHYGEWASLSIRSAISVGTTVEINLPVGLTHGSLPIASATAASAERARG